MRREMRLRTRPHPIARRRMVRPMSWRRQRLSRVPRESRKLPKTTYWAAQDSNL